MGPTKTLCWTFRSLKNSSPSPTLSKTPCVLFFVLLHDFYILSTSVAFGVAVAFTWWMAGAPLHRAGEDQEEPIVPAVVPEQWDSQPASQAEGGGRGRGRAAALAGPSDRDRDWGVCGRGGRHLHDSQSPQCCHPGVLHVLLLSDATGVCVCDSPLKNLTVVQHSGRHWIHIFIYCFVLSMLLLTLSLLYFFALSSVVLQNDVTSLHWVCLQAWRGAQVFCNQVGFWLLTFIFQSVCYFLLFLFCLISHCCVFFF